MCKNEINIIISNYLKNTIHSSLKLYKSNPDKVSLRSLKFFFILPIPLIFLLVFLLNSNLDKIINLIF